MAGPIRIAVLANAAQAKKEIAAVESRGQRMSKGLKVAGKIAAAGLLVVAAAGVKAGQAAAEDEQQQSRLAQTLRTGAKATKAQIDQTEKYVTAAGKAFGVADSELRPALSKLAIATGSVEKAQHLANIAMDVSAGSGKKLEAVSQALAKAQATGNVAALAKFGVATKDAKGKTLSLAAVTQKLADKYKGAASKNAETAAGKQKILAVQMGELQEQIGAGLLPVFQKLTAVGLKAVEWISENTGKAKALAIVIGALAAVILVANLALKAYTLAAGIYNAITTIQAANAKRAAAGQISLNLAMLANPVLLIVAGIVLLIAGLVLAYKKSDKFRAIVNGAFAAVVNGVKAAFGFIKSKWPLILAILTGPFGIAVLLIAKNWSKIKDGATATKKWISDKFTALVGILKTVGGQIKDALLAPFNAIRDAVQHVLDLISKIKVPHVDLNPFNGRAVAGNSGGFTTTGDAQAALIAVDQSTTNQSNLNVSVTLSATPGVSGVDLGREFVTYIKQYYAVGGERL